MTVPVLLRVRMGHDVDSERVTFRRNPDLPGNALRQLENELARVTEPQGDPAMTLPELLECPICHQPHVRRLVEEGVCWMRGPELARYAPPAPATAADVAVLQDEVVRLRADLTDRARTVAATAVDERAALIDELRGEVERLTAEVARLTVERDAYRKIAREHMC